MSHAYGTATFSADNHIMHFEYNGTTDVAISALWDTKQEVTNHWREGIWNACVCGKSEDVIFFADYGDGIHWQGKACRYCRAIITTDPYEYDHNDKYGSYLWLIE